MATISIIGYILTESNTNLHMMLQDQCTPLAAAAAPPPPAALELLHAPFLELFLYPRSVSNI